ncbi:MAG: TIGR04282 family arsenosugar biosynthesis glycosyltransferase [Gemmatimonadetes bacterium]|nr:TIGR04282 family arsenosugar biosynthesis glycosyltransferase [Gemmatimonadota bacterium]
MCRSLRPDVLGVLVKAPVPGRVKTRLASTVGVRRATEIYRRLGRQIVGACAGPGHDTVVWYAPAEARAAVRDWLKGLPVAAYRAQVSGALGARLAAAFQRHFGEGAHRVILIGSDCPRVDAGLVSRALAALDDHALVLGPAYDGGYYLIGLRTPVPQLFRGIAWSTEMVLEQTLTRARQLGLRTVLLPVLRDVDTVSDARAAGMVEPSGLHE